LSPLRSGGVQVDRTVLLGKLGELVGDDELLRRGLRVLEDFLELRELGGVLADELAVLGVVRGIGVFDLGQRDLLGWVVGGADLVGALEGHVLEHVGQAAGALRIVGRACVDQRVIAEDRRLRPLADDEREAVGQDFDGSLLLEAGEVLRHARRALRPRGSSPAHGKRQHYADQTTYSHE
jgi:hypothetical protein